MRVNGRNILAGSGIDTPASQTMLLSDTFGELNMCPGQNQEAMRLDTKYDLTDATLTPVGRPPRNYVGVNRTQPRILTDGGDLAADGATWTTPPTAEAGFWIANAGYIGIGIHDRCSDMSVQLTRTGTPSTPRTPATLATDVPTTSAGNYQALDLNIYAEVSKILTVSNGSYKISYM